MGIDVKVAGTERLAVWISALFHPFVWIALAFLVVLWQERMVVPQAVGLGVLYVLLAAGLPVLVLYLLHKTRLSADVYLSKAKERRKFLPVELAMIVPALVVVCYTATVSRMALFYLVVALVSLVVYVGSLRWVKMSVHVGVLTGIGWGMVLWFGWAWGLFLLLVLPVGWARWKLRQHTGWELAMGFVSVSVTTLATWMILSW